MTTIKVTPEHIAIGRPDAAAHCPVALALISAGFTDPQVASDQISFRMIGDKLWICTPPSVAEFVDCFDSESLRADFCAPFEFQIDLTAARFSPY
jgi:hypothetical protein